MATIAQGASQTVDLAANQSILVGTDGLAYVDFVAGAPGAPYDSRRIDAKVSQRFGPYGVVARLRVRSVQGTADYSDVVSATDVTSNRGAASGIDRWMGGQGSTAMGGYAGRSAGYPCYYMKHEAEAPVRAVRVWLFSREHNDCSREWEACVAPTEVADNSTINNAFVPQTTPPTGWPSAGTRNAYNAYVTNTDASTFGWRRVTWGGNNKSPILYPGSDMMPVDYGVSGGYSAVAGMICSDIIPIQSVPTVGGTRPHILLRLRRGSRAGDAHSWINVYSNDADGYNPLYALHRAKVDGQPYGRTRYMQEANSVDGVNTLATMPASVLSFASNNGTNMGAPYFGLEFFYDVPVRSLVSLGDSTFEQGAPARYGYMTWIPMAVYSKSSPSAPWSYLNGGASSMMSNTYDQLLHQLVRLGQRPTDVLLEAFSVNEFGLAQGVNTARLPTEVIARHEAVLAQCKKIGARLLISNSIYPPGNSNGGPLQTYQTVDNWVTAVCAAGHATLVDLRSGINQATHLRSDDGYTHFTIAGGEYARGVLASVL